MKITAGYVENYHDIDADEVRMNVPWKITEGKTTLLEGNQSFPLDTDKEDIKAFLTRCLSTFKEDLARHEAAKEHQTNLDHAADVGKDISGVSIND